MKFKSLNVEQIFCCIDYDDSDQVMSRRLRLNKKSMKTGILITDEEYGAV